MPTAELRSHFGQKSPDDLVVTISDKTYDYLMTLSLPTARVSSYLERDWPRVEKTYAELFLAEDCPSRFRVNQVIPGSKTRWSVNLPDEMKEGEQLTLLVDRSPHTIE